MKTRILIAFFCLAVTSLTAQHISFNWQNCIKGGRYDTNRSVLCKADKGYFVAATQQRGTNDDIVLIKTSLAGDSIWSKYYGGTDDDWTCGVFPTRDGNYFLIGTESSNDGDITINPYPNSCNVWVIKIDSLGTKLWDKIYGGTYRDEAIAAITTNDGGLAILSNTYSDDGDVTHYFWGKDIWVLKLDSNGMKQWDFTMGSVWNDYSSGIMQTQDSGFIISGAFNIGKGGNIDCSYSDTNIVDGLIFQLDKYGNLQRQKCFHGSGADDIKSVVELPDGYLISGYTDSPDISLTDIGFHHGTTHNGNPTGDYWVQKTDNDWNLEWQRCYGGWGNEDLSRLYLCSNGDFMMFGTTDSYSGDVVGIHWYDPVSTEADIWMVRLSATGDILWQRCIGKMGAEELMNDGILKLNDAQYILAIGTNGCFIDGDFTCSPTPNPYCPYYTWLIQITDSAASVGVNQQPFSIEAKLYPNPAHDYATVDIPLTYNLQNAQAEILDASGRVMESFGVKQKQFAINVTGYSKGIYLLRICDAQGVITKRFIVE